MAHLGASIEDVVVFGDGSNDVCMFLPEWTSVAMGNAIDELKQRADYVTTMSTMTAFGMRAFISGSSKPDKPAQNLLYARSV